MEKKYTSKEFNLFCKEIDIEHQLITSYTSQQNRVRGEIDAYGDDQMYASWQGVVKEVLG